MRAMHSNLSSSVLSDKVAGTFSYLLQGKSYNSVSLVTGIMLMEKKGLCKETSGISSAGHIQSHFNIRQTFFRGGFQ